MKHEEFLKLLENREVVQFDEAKLNHLDTSAYYLRKNGQLIILLPSCPEYIQVFSSFEEFKALRAKIQMDSSEGHILLDYQVWLSEHTDLSKVSPDYLCNYLGIPPAKMDFTAESLLLIDTAIRERGITWHTFVKDLYIQVFVYLGQVICLTENAQWIIHRNEGIIEPYLQKDGKKFNLFKLLYEEALENYEELSIYSLAAPWFL